MSINTGMDEDDVCDIKDTVEIFSTRKNEVTLFERKWMQLEIITK